MEKETTVGSKAGIDVLFFYHADWMCSKTSANPVPMTPADGGSRKNNITSKYYDAQGQEFDMVLTGNTMVPRACNST